MKVICGSAWALLVVLAGGVLPASPAAAQQGYDCAHGPDSYRVRNVPSWDRLNIRSNPNSKSAIVGSIPATGSGVLCKGPCQGKWCRIDWRGIVGWVNMRFLGE